MTFDVELLSRIQFALTAMFHYLYPPLTIGLGWIMFIMEWQFMRTGNMLYEQMARFWTRIFAVTFAMGVATGIVLEFEFGTNWAVYSKYVGDVFGSALAAEGIFAFFLESGFLAILVFGWDRVSSKMHFFSTLMVAAGSTFSAIWIVVANSWQQTPAGYHIVGEGASARAEITDFWAMVFNPSSMHRLNHVILGALVLGGFFVMSITAYYILKNRHQQFARKSFIIALWVALIASVATLGSGHLQAKKVAETQPAKLAAFEGHFNTTEGGADLWLFGLPDEAAREVKMGLKIPGGLSFLVHESFNEPVTALDEFPKEDWPPVNLSFQTYHMMVGLGMLQIALTLTAAFFWWKGTLFNQRWLLWTFVFAVVSPYSANQAGWVSAEVGRQPWIVYNLLRTSDAVSPAVSGGQVMGSIIMFTLIYILLFIVWIYVLNDKIQKGPEVIEVAGKRQGGFFSVATERASPDGASMTTVHQDIDADAKEEEN